MRRCFRVVSTFNPDDYSRLFTPTGGLRAKGKKFRSRREALQYAYDAADNDLTPFVLKRTKSGWKLVDWFHHF